VRANKAEYRVATMCRALGISTSGYYASVDRKPSNRACADEVLSKQIAAIHQKSRETYGRPRVHAELKDDGVHIGCKRVSRLMRQAGLQGASRRKRYRTTVRNRDARPAPDLVDRNFVADGPDKLWVADITYVPTVVLDAFSRRIVGWAMANHLRTELVLDALNMAVGCRAPQGVIHHSDQGCQYTSIAFGLRCKQAGVRPSMGSVGDCYDNAMCESFFATLECELLERKRFQNQTEARMAIFEFIEGWYNSHRRHSSLNYLSPMTFERRSQLPTAATVAEPMYASV
jgi:putative transposase